MMMDAALFFAVFLTSGMFFSRVFAARDNHLEMRLFNSNGPAREVFHMFATFGYEYTKQKTAVDERLINPLEFVV